MIRKITLSDGQVVEVECLSCAITSVMFEPTGGVIVETTHFQAHQDQREALGIEHVVYFYNEDTAHHFHLWMVPRYGWMKEHGKSVESLRPALLHARNHMNNEENSQNVIAPEMS